MMIETSNIWWNDQGHILPLGSGPSNWAGMNGAVTASSETGADGQKITIRVKLPDEIVLKIGINTSPGGGKLPFMSMVLGSRQITGQDGHCGNFNRDASDETQELEDQRAPVAAKELLIPY